MSTVQPLESGSRYDIRTGVSPDAPDEDKFKDAADPLRIVFVSGSQLGAELATRALKDLGPVVYNLYGSTEVALATLAQIGQRR